MSNANIRGGILFSLYEQYIGEPKSKKQVYGYWLFIIGYVLGFAGILLFVTELWQAGDPNWFLRGAGVSLAAGGLPLAMFGIVLLLPVRERGIHATLVGLGVTFIGVIAFNLAYPSNWWVDSAADYSGVVVAIYSVGLAIVAGVIVLVPILTGKEGMLVEDEMQGLDAHPPVLVGQKDHGTLFSVFRRPGSEWTWRAVQQSALATGIDSLESRTAAKDAVDTLKAKVNSARLLEITTAAFRLYENEQGVWRWVLMRDDGSVIAESVDQYDSRDEAEDAVSFTKDRGPDAPLLDIEGAAFDVYRDGDDWRWRLLDEERTVMAESPNRHADEASAEDAIASVTDRIGDARVLAFDSFGVELFEDGGEWCWRLLDTADEEVARSAVGFDSRRNAETGADEVLDQFGSATVLHSGQPGIEVYQSGSDWQWRLLDDDDETVARSPGGAGDRSDVQQGAERLCAEAADAKTVQFDGAEYEIYRANEGWNWRFVTDEREVIADHTQGYETIEDAEEAIERVREQASEADLLEFETAAFQQYQTVTGDWRWRLIDEDGAVLADSGQAYDSKDDAGNAMVTLKEKAPDAELLEIETAAFELFQNDNDSWGWRLIDEGGRLVAEGAKSHATKQGAREAMDYLVDNSPGADVESIDGAIFEVFSEGSDDWQWRCLYEDNTIIAESPEGYATRDDAEGAIERVKPNATSAAIHTIEGLAFEIDPDSEYRWDVLDQQRETVVVGGRSYEEAEAAESAIEELKANAGDATTFTIEDAAIRLQQSESGWSWELIDRDRTVYARSGGQYDTREVVLDTIEELQVLAPDAEFLEFETAGIEIVEADDGWRWQLLNGDEDVVAASATVYEERSALIDAIDDIRDLLVSASILEIDDPTFELHQQEGGWIWRLVDENGIGLAESAESYPTRSAARERMNTLKEQAPDGSLSVAG
ncbi:DUF1508 domain-containing protein [Natranaeroarchaeum sulfidigenes]|uniref:Putative membrane protein n=1 Tax=Natranaeroarchaeum sulfidigenes TaxID=2784880 RepID=A0A897MRI0_9EURY|nr:DUF1508 domain-containing protein [Natranaeroarchaeum sulfidigenes]QSG03164.1 putative membrane protein [Natranaeroarchaeum sulfidigenes]